MKRLLVIALLFFTCAKAYLCAQSGISFQKVVVTFNYKADVLNNFAQTRIDSLMKAIKAGNYTIRQVQVFGHCDSVGSNLYNNLLSERRAQSVKKYLVTKGVDESLITQMTGYGKQKPLNDNRDSLSRSYNRRVEISVTLAAPEKKEVVKALKANDAAKVDSVKRETIDISNAQVNDIIQLQDINFLPDRHIVTDASFKALHTLVNTMRANPTLRIEIRGHVCCLPDYQGDAFDQDTYTEDLSLQRAKDIYLYLADSHIAKDRMTYVGLGAKYPLVKEFDEFDKAKNRRVELRILSK